MLIELFYAILTRRLHFGSVTFFIAFWLWFPTFMQFSGSNNQVAHYELFIL